MRNQFKRALHQFLEKEQISLESGIVNELTYRLAGIKFQEEELSEGFSFNDRYFSEEDKDEIRFTVPSGFSLNKLYKILDLFGIDHENYMLNKALTLDSKFVMTKFVPLLIDHFYKMKESEPKAVAQYKIKSAPILESTAKETLRKYITETKKILLAEKLKELTTHQKHLIDFIMLLSSKMEAIDNFPLFYKDVLDGTHDIKTFLRMQGISTNEKLASKLAMIGEGIELYARYHRNESVLALISVQEDLKSFLNNYQISTEAEGCDLLEHVVLHLAGAKQSSPAPSQFSIGSDPARFTITFKDIDKENTQKVIQYMQALGDETATEGYGFRHYGSSMAESMSSQRAYAMSSSFNPKKKRTESHTIEVDGKFFYNVVFPKIKETIEQMAAENSLTKYQELSKEFFNQESNTLKPSSVSMFQQNKEAVPKQEFAVQLEM